MARAKKGAARAAPPGSIFVWVEVDGGRALLSRRRAEALGLTVSGPTPKPSEDSDEETAADARSESVTAVDVADAGDVPTLVEGGRTESVTPVDVPATPVTTKKAAARKPAAKKRSTSTRSRRTG
jgi:hypothetical protein